MFTGIVTDVGRIDAITTLDQGKMFRVATRFDTATMDIGASVAHNGVCLTVVEKGTGWIEVEAWEEALRLTTLGTINQEIDADANRHFKGANHIFNHAIGLFQGQPHPFK